MRKTKIIAIANQKGGVGKTTTTINFADCLAKKDYKVLLVDFDHQGNLTIGCGIMDADERDDTIANCIVQHIEGKRWKLPIINTKKNIDLIPANITLSVANLLMIQAMAREHILKTLLESVDGKYDYILIDCAPSLSIDLINALTAADEVLIVTNAASFSAAGVNQLVSSILKVKKSLNRELEISGVLFNKVDRRTTFAKSVIDSSKELLGESMIFKTEIPISIKVDESQSIGKSILDYKAKNKVSEGFSLFTEEYLKR